MGHIFWLNNITIADANGNELYSSDDSSMKVSLEPVRTDGEDIAFSTSTFEGFTFTATKTLTTEEFTMFNRWFKQQFIREMIRRMVNYYESVN